MTKREQARAYAAEHPDATYAEIGRAVGTTPSNARKALNPEIAAEYERRIGNDRKRRWDEAHRVACSRCGRLRGGGTERSDGSRRLSKAAGDLCATCRSDGRAARVMEMVRLRREEDLTNRQIAVLFDCPVSTVTQELARMRAIGFDVPLAAYARAKGKAQRPTKMTREAWSLRRILEARGITPEREVVAA